MIPALVAVACAIACGGTSIDGDGGEGVGDPGSGGTSTGATFGRGGGPVISSGGANGIPGGSAGGSVGILYGCPPSAPRDGSRCAMPPNGLGACGYFDSCGQQLTAICHQGAKWQVLASGMECDGGAPNDPTEPLVCPTRRPPSGTKCDLPASVTNYQCMYAEGCVDLIETCDQHRVWFTSASFTDCAGAGGAG